MARTRILLALGSIGAFTLLVALEIATENERVSAADLAVDVLALLLTVLTAAFAVSLADNIRRHGEETRALLAELAEAKAEGAAWRGAAEQHVAGLNAAIEAQLAAWGVTDAERDVAYLILKGFSHKEIALLRTTSERTVRQQAQAIYRKSGLAGKNAFVSYFLDELLRPDANGAETEGRRSVRHATEAAAAAR
jgi:DNA-binding CsgD family transcriptional regulator